MDERAISGLSDVVAGAISQDPKRNRPLALGELGKRLQVPQRRIGPLPHSNRHSSSCRQPRPFAHKEPGQLPGALFLRLNRQKVASFANQDAPFRYDALGASARAISSTEPKKAREAAMNSSGVTSASISSVRSVGIWSGVATRTTCTLAAPRRERSPGKVASCHALPSNAAMLRAASFTPFASRLLYRNWNYR